MNQISDLNSVGIVTKSLDIPFSPRIEFDVRTHELTDFQEVTIPTQPTFLLSLVILEPELFDGKCVPDYVGKNDVVFVSVSWHLC